MATETETAVATETAEDGAPVAKRDEEQPVELPASATWTPAQALAAAAKIPFAEVVIIGFKEDGQVAVRHSRSKLVQLNWLGDALKDYALGDVSDIDAG